MAKKKELSLIDRVEQENIQQKSPFNQEGVKSFVKDAMGKMGVEYSDEKANEIIDSYDYDYDRLIDFAAKKTGIKDPLSFRDAVYNKYGFSKPSDTDLAELRFVKTPTTADPEGGYERQKALDDELKLATAFIENIKSSEITPEIEEAPELTEEEKLLQSQLKDTQADVTRTEQLTPSIKPTDPRILALQEKTKQIENALREQSDYNIKKTGFASEKHEAINNEFQKYDALLDQALKERAAKSITYENYFVETRPEDDARVNDLQNIKEIYRDLGKLLGAPQGKGWEKQANALLYGLGNNFFTQDFVSLGLNEMGRLANVKNAFDTKQKLINEGKTEEEIAQIMPSSELALLDTYHMMLEIQAGADPNNLYYWGEGLKEMIPFIVQFAATSGFGAGAKKAVSEFVEAKTKSAAAAKITGAITKPLVQAGAMIPANLLGYAERVAPTMDQEGNLIEGMNPLKAAVIAYANTVAEVVGEDVGSYIGKSTNKAVRESYRKMIGSNPSKAKEFLGKMALTLTRDTNIPTIQGVAFEGLGEEVTGLLQTVINQDDSFFTSEAQKQIWGMSLIASGTFMSTSVPGRLRAKSNYNKSKTLLDDIPNAEYAKTVEELSNNYDNIEDLTDALGQINEQFGNEISLEDKAKARNYVSNTIVYNQMNTARAIAVEEQIAKNIGQDGNVTMTIYNGQPYTVNNPKDLGQDGKVIFLKDSEGNVKPVISSKISDYETKTPNEIIDETLSAQDQNDAAIEAEQQQAEETANMAAEKGLVEGKTVITPDGKKTLVSVNPDGTSTVVNDKGEESIVNTDEIEAYKTQEQKDAEKAELEGQEVVSDEPLFEGSNIRVVDYANGTSTIITPEGEQTFETTEERDAAIEALAKAELEASEVEGETIDDLSPEEAYVQMLKTDPEIAAEVLQEDIASIRVQAEEARSQAKQVQSRQERVNLLKQAKELEAEAIRLEGILADPTPVTDEVVEQEQPLEESYERTPDLIHAEYTQEKENAPINQLLPWQQELLAKKVSPESFNKFGDRNNVTNPMKRAWFVSKEQANTSNNIDVIAEELSEMGVEVTPDDIVNFITDHPTATVRKTTDAMAELQKEYKELTGESITKHKETATGLTQEQLDEVPFRIEGVQSTDRAAKDLSHKQNANKAIEKLSNELGVGIMVVHSSEMPKSVSKEDIVYDEKGQVLAFSYEGNLFVTSDKINTISGVKKAIVLQAIKANGIETFINNPTFKGKLKGLDVTSKSGINKLVKAVRSELGFSSKQFNVDDINNIDRTFDVNDVFSVINAPGAAEVVVVNSENELPDVVRNHELYNWEKFDAVFAEGKIFVNNNNVRSRDEAVAIWVHENGLHKGIRTLIPDIAQRNALFESVYNSVMSMTSMSAELNESIKQVLASYTDRPIAEQGEEIMAFYAEKIVNGEDLTPAEKTVWTKITEIVKNILNKLYRLEPQLLTEMDIANIVYASVKSTLNEQGNIDTATNQEVRKRTQPSTPDFTGSQRRDVSRQELQSPIEDKISLIKEEDAETVRSDEGQVQESRDVRETIAEESRENLQFQEEARAEAGDAERVRFKTEEGQTFEEWKGDNRYVEDYEISDVKTGEPIVAKAYHGTTHEIYEFKGGEVGNIEGHPGKTNYFTSDYSDAEQNYGAEGADLTIRIEQRKIRVEQELEDERFDNENFLEEENIQEIKDTYDLTDDDLDRNIEDLSDIAYIIAEKELKGGEEQVLELYVKLNNPLVLGKDPVYIKVIDETELADYLDDAAQEVADENGIELEEAKEDYSYEIRERAIENSGAENKVIEALRLALEGNENYNEPSQYLPEELLFEEQVDLNQIDKDLRSNLNEAFLENNEGELISSQVMSDFYEELGYDGVILTDVNERFANMNLHDGVSHIHVPDQYNNQIKLADGSNTTFGETSNIRFRAIGKYGADRLDAAEEVTTRLDNLEVAKKMDEEGIDNAFNKAADLYAKALDLNEKEDWDTDRSDIDEAITKLYMKLGYKDAYSANKDAHKEISNALKNKDVSQLPKSIGDLSIKNATGWEKGADNKWRYEVPDAEVKNLDRLKEVKNNSLFAHDKVDLISYEINPDNTYKILLKGKDAENTKTGFVKYDKLRKNELSEFLGNDIANAIKSGKANKLDVTLDLDDGVSYEIKDQEFDYNAENGIPLKDIISDKTLFSEYPALNDIIVFFDKKQGRGAAYVIDGTNEYIRLGTELPLTSNVLNRVINHEIQHAIQQLEGFAQGGSPSQFRRDVGKAHNIAKQKGLTGKDLTDQEIYIELYRALSGEVEARNVEKRFGMTPNEIRKSLMSSTEDVSREDQIFIQDNIMSLGEPRFRQTETTEFKNWFGNSQIVDEQGKPKVMYHATGEDFDAFKTQTEEQIFGKGIIFASPDAKWAQEGFMPLNKEKGTSGSVMPLYVKSENPFDYRNEEHLNELFEKVELRDKAKDHVRNGRPMGLEKPKVVEAIKELGYDGLYVTEEGMTNIGVFNPNQVKSATGNIGTFDPETDDVRFRTEETFYSPTEKALQSIKQEKGTVSQFEQMLLKNGAKQAELDWMGFREQFPSVNSKVTKQDIQDWIDNNKIEIQEVEKGKEGDEQHQTIEEIADAKEVLAQGGSLYAIDSSGQAIKIVKDSNEIAPYIIDNWDNYTVKQGNIKDINRENPTKYADYQLPGGKNYKELLLTMPSKRGTSDDYAQLMFGKPYDQLSLNDQASVNRSFSTTKNQDYKSSHFDEPNILAHTRFNERYDSEGNKVLFIEELQSDWAQEGRKKGFKNKSFKWDDELGNRAVKAIKDEDNLGFNSWQEAAYEIQKDADFFNTWDVSYENMKTLVEWREAVTQKVKVPDMPFKKTDQWLNLGLRRMIRYAAENGFDKIAWTTGEQQAERYDLSKQVDELRYEKQPNGEYYIEAVSDGVITDMGMHEANKLEDVIGKEIAKKIIDGDGIQDEALGDMTALIGEDLKVGGEGMKSFYNKMVPKAANKLGKKFGAKVEPMDMYYGENFKQLSLPITDKMKETVMKEGVPMFRVDPIYPESDYELNEDEEWRFTMDLQSALTGNMLAKDYSVINGNSILRIKDHTPNWRNFIDDLDENPNIKRVINITVGNYNDIDYRLNKRTLEELQDKYPDIEFFDYNIEDGESLYDNIDFFHKTIQREISGDEVKFKVEEERDKVETNPSEAQVEAGNYQKGHIQFDGFDITIENPKGSIRRGTNEKGETWSNIMPGDYGYFKGTVGKDKDHIDVLMGDNLESYKVYVVDQVNPETGAFDEHKVIIGTNSLSEAKNLYMEGYEEGWEGLGAITRTNKDGLKEWFKGDTKKPFAPEADVRFQVTSKDPKIQAMLDKLAKVQEASRTAAKVKGLQDDLLKSIGPERKFIQDKIDLYKEAVEGGKEETKELIKEVQNVITAYAKKALPLTEAGAREISPILTLIKNAQTPKDVEAAFNRIDELAGISAEKQERRKYVAKVNRLLKWMTGLKKSGTKKVGKFNYEDTKAFLELKDIDKRITALTKVKNSTKATEEQKAEAESKLNQEWETLNAKENRTSLDDAILKLIELRRLGSKASPALAKAVSEELEIIYSEAKEAKSEADIEKAISRKDDKEFIKNFVRDSNLEDKPWYKQAVTKLNNFTANTVGNWETLMTMLGGFKARDKFSLIINQVEEEMGIQNSFNTVLDKAEKDYGLKSRDQVLKHIQELKKEDYELRKPNRAGKEGEGKPMKLSKMNLIDIYNAVKNEEIANSYYMSYGDITLNEDGSRDTDTQRASGKERIDALIANLSDADKAFGDSMMEVVNTYKESTNDVFIKMFNRDMDFVENYWPSTAEFESDVDVMDKYFTEGKMPSATQQRSQGRTPRPVDAFDKFNKHVKESEWYKNMAMPLDRINRIFKDQNVQDLVSEARGEKFLKTIQTHFKNLGLGASTRDLTDVERVGGNILGNWVAAKIGLTPSVPFKQLTSMINYAENMPVGQWGVNFIGGLATPKATFDYMWENVPYLRDRFKGGYSEALQYAMNATKGLPKATNTQQAIKNIATIGTRGGDIAAIVFGGKPYLDYLMKQGMSKEEAVNKFMLDTLRSQQSPFSSTLSTYQNSKNPFAKALFTFANTPSQYMRKMFEASQAYRHGDISAAQLSKIYAIYGLANQFLYVGAGALISSLMRGSDPGEELWENTFVQSLTSLVAGIPLVRDIANTTLKRTTGLHVYDDALPVIGELDQIGEAITKAIQGKDAEKNMEKAAILLLEMGGIPAGNAKKLWDSTVNREEVVAKTVKYEVRDKLNDLSKSENPFEARKAKELKSAYSSAKSKATRLEKEGKVIQAGMINSLIEESQMNLRDNKYDKLGSELRRFEARLNAID